MSLVINGVTIPTNVANALMVKGVSVTQVIANGVEIWKQALGLIAGWSGSTIGTASNGVQYGLANSGMTSALEGAGYPAVGVVTVSSEGTFSGTSTKAVQFSASQVVTGSGPNLIFGTAYAPNLATLVYSPITKFGNANLTFSNFSGYSANLQASLGLMRIGERLDQTGTFGYGAWISLT